MKSIIEPVCASETIQPRLCFCGVHASFKVSWTTNNPGRRFFNCGSKRVEKCEFFQWYDNYPGKWLNATLGTLLNRVDELEGFVENERVKIDMGDASTVTLLDRVNKLECFVKNERDSRFLLERVDRLYVSNGRLKLVILILLFVVGMLICHMYF